MPLENPDNGFDEFLAVLRDHAGNPTPKLVGFLRIAYKAGHTAGAAKAASIMMPGLRAALASAESGAATYKVIRDIPDKIDELLASVSPDA